MRLIKTDLQVYLQTENDLYVHMDTIINNSVVIENEVIEEVFMQWAYLKRNKQTDCNFGDYCGQRGLHLIKEVK